MMAAAPKAGRAREEEDDDDADAATASPPTKGDTTTTFPTCFAWLICLKAAAACAKECDACGKGESAPVASPRATRLIAAPSARSGIKSTATSE
jgi:hypothetical protein